MTDTTDRTELKRQLAALTLARANRVQALQTEIQTTNQRFDREALRLKRQIDKLEAVEPKPKPTKPRKPQRDLMAQIQESLDLADEVLK